MLVVTPTSIATPLSLSAAKSTAPEETVTKYDISLIADVSIDSQPNLQWIKITDTASGHVAYGQVRDECPGCGKYSLGRTELFLKNSILTLCEQISLLVSLSSLLLSASGYSTFRGITRLSDSALRHSERWRQSSRLL